MAVKGPGVNAKNGLFQVKKVGCVWRVMPPGGGTAGRMFHKPGLPAAVEVGSRKF